MEVEIGEQISLPIPQQHQGGGGAKGGGRWEINTKSVLPSPCGQKTGSLMLKEAVVAFT